MDFRIADTFTDALARLPAQEQKAVKVSMVDLQLDPTAPGLQLHRIDKSKDENFLVGAGQQGPAASPAQDGVQHPGGLCGSPRPRLRLGRTAED